MIRLCSSPVLRDFMSPMIKTHRCVLRSMATSVIPMSEALVQIFWRDANIDADMFGMLVSLEAQKPITDTSVSLVGRVFGGLYHLNADGDFSDNFGVQNTSDDISKWGYRIGAEAGIRADLSERLFLSLDRFSGSLLRCGDGGASAICDRSNRGSAYRHR